jgi:hypothetical protein
MVLPEERAVRRPIAGSLTADRGILMRGTRALVDPVDALLVESMHEALTDLLGRRAREAIYDHLERNRLIARNEIPDRLCDFLRLLDETFGKGSRTIGKVIARKLYAKLGWEFVEISSYGLEDYLEVARVRVGKGLINNMNHM